ncbi:hypothetical protein [Terasakiella pusilla]|uniref:hypothetical protein n=1 Tax=Terasakiella pusilla TaxID=64973 RepID=UPI000490FCF5|nr:hypothetical protein [Terasakiella pusilla]
MNKIKVSWNRRTFKRFGLPLGVCLMAGMISGAQAQTAAFDPFAPDAMAPQEPSANPTAPKPVAPVLPPRLTASPAIPRQTGVAPPVPTAAPAGPAPTHVAPLPAPILPPASTAHPTAPQAQAQAQAAPLSDLEKLQRLQNTLGQTTDQAAATPFEQNTLSPTQPVAPPKVATPASNVQTSPPAPEPQPALSRPLPKPVLEEVAEPAPKRLAPDPAPVTTASAPAPSDGTLLDNIGSFFGNLFSSSTDSATPEETQTKDSSAPSSPLTEETQPSAKKAPEKDTVEDQSAHPQAVTIDPRLPAAIFGLGSDVHLGQSTASLSEQAQCFTKNRGIVTYCINPTKWASSLERHFDVSTHLYKGEKAIIQFDGDIATRLYALFNSEGFQEITRYFEEKFGPPTHHFSRTTRTLKKGDVDNPTYVWRKDNEVEGLTEVFEIRQIADTRGSLPDLQRGSIRVYFEGARSIFSLSSDLDFMELH